MTALPDRLALTKGNNEGWRRRRQQQQNEQGVHHSQLLAILSWPGLPCRALFLLLPAAVLLLLPAAAVLLLYLCGFRSCRGPKAS